MPRWGLVGWCTESCPAFSSLVPRIILAASGMETRRFSFPTPLRPLLSFPRRKKKQKKTKQDANKRDICRPRSDGFDAPQGSWRRGVLPRGGVPGGRDGAHQGRRVRRVRPVPESGAEGDGKG